VVNARKILILTDFLNRKNPVWISENRVFFTQNRPRAAALTMPELTMTCRAKVVSVQYTHHHVRR
jgi:hypothetical protein